VFRKLGGRFLVRGGQSVTPEGTLLQRNVVLELPSYAEAVACYESSGYQQVRTPRAAASKADIVIIEGYDGPQP
jgi:uncharacterized protein (DUF1330 family)